MGSNNPFINYFLFYLYDVPAGQGVNQLILNLSMNQNAYILLSYIPGILKPSIRII